MASVRLSHVYKKYAGSSNATVTDFHLDIADKEFLVLVGPSGCGKSTTLRMVAGLEDISSGDLFIDGKRVNDVQPKDRDIAMVFQSYALYPHMSVYENMAFSLKLRGMSKPHIHARVLDAARILSIEHLLDRKPKALSGGQRQRVALGRAIVREPKVFLMDEPLSNLDAKLRVQMRAEISKLHKRLKTTVIYVTHDQTEAMTMGTRIVVMKDGFVQQVDTPENVYNHPNNTFVAGFIGSPSMNFMKGRLHDDGTTMRFRSKNVDVVVPEGRAKLLRQKSVTNTEIIFGIRPEDVHRELIFLEASQTSIVRVVVDVCENLGSELFLYVSGVGDAPFTARIDGRERVKSGEEIDLCFDMNKAHFFYTDTQNNVLLPD